MFTYLILKLFVAVSGWCLLMLLYQYLVILPQVQEECYRVLQRYGRMQKSQIVEEINNSKGDVTWTQVELALSNLIAEGLVIREKGEESPERGGLHTFYYRCTGKPKREKESIFAPVPSTLIPSHQLF